MRMFLTIEGKIEHDVYTLDSIDRVLMSGGTVELDGGVKVVKTGIGYTIIQGSRIIECGYHEDDMFDRLYRAGMFTTSPMFLRPLE